MFDLKNTIPYKKNPRGITKIARTKLKDGLEQFGDLSGIVINIRTGEIVSGNQRGDILDIRTADVEWDIYYEEPTKVGSVAFGRTEINGEPFSVRLVDWDEVTADIANLIANKAGGYFDFDILLNEFEDDVLFAGGFTHDELSGYFPDDDDLDDLDDEQSGEGYGNEEPKFHTLTINCKSPEQRKELEFLLVDLFEEMGDPDLTYDVSK